MIESFFFIGHAECVEVLLELGAPLHPRSTEGDTPRDLALHCGHLHIAELIDNYSVQPPKTLPRMWLHENLGRKVRGLSSVVNHGWENIKGSHQLTQAVVALCQLDWQSYQGPKWLSTNDVQLSSI